MSEIRTRLMLKLSNNVSSLGGELHDPHIVAVDKLPDDMYGLSVIRGDSTLAVGVSLTRSEVMQLSQMLKAMLSVDSQ